MLIQIDFSKNELKNQPEMTRSSKPLQAYDHPAQFEPLLPSSLRALETPAAEVVSASLRLQGAVHPETVAVLREQVRAMNSYHSNQIEGQGTHPRHIDEALRRHFSDAPDIARRQRIALAHIEAERWLEQQGFTGAQALSSEVLKQAHHALYSRLDAADRLSDNGRPVVPGALRERDVAVGRHQPLRHASVPAFLARADQVYARAAAPHHQLVAIACAHQRMAWVHPFEDGNGRACRLQSHAALSGLSHGLWSVNRGLARHRQAYYQHLDAADMPRQGDLDGRGNLSERALVQWCGFFLDQCLDQVRFMSGLLNLDGLKARVQALIATRQAERRGEGYRPEAVLPLLHVLALGRVSRAEFTQMTGLEARTARKVISQLLKDGLLCSEHHRAELRLGLPLDALPILFPALYPEASAPVQD